MKHTFFIGLLLTVSFCTTACGGKKQVPDEQLTERTTDDPADLDEVDAADLADSPCGNPDWSKLPEGSDPPDPSSN